MIPQQPFGRTEHTSTRMIFGAYALSEATQAEADRTLELLLEYGVNHIDTAPMYGNAEKRIGPWMEKHRGEFFIATKTRKRSYQGAWGDLQRSLDRLRQHKPLLPGELDRHRDQPAEQVVGSGKDGRLVHKALLGTGILESREQRNP